MENGPVKIVDNGLPLNPPLLPNEIKHAPKTMIEEMEKLRLELVAPSRHST
jgi:hypothetical protein